MVWKRYLGKFTLKFGSSRGNFDEARVDLDKLCRERKSREVGEEI